MEDVAGKTRDEVSVRVGEVPAESPDVELPPDEVSRLDDAEGADGVVGCGVETMGGDDTIVTDWSVGDVVIATEVATGDRI